MGYNFVYLNAILLCQILHKCCIQAFFNIADAKAISQTPLQLNL